MKYENTLEDHFPDHDIHDEVACECNEALQVGSLTEHIISRKHYGTAGTHCNQCNSALARANMLKAHKGMFKGAKSSQAKTTKKRRIA